jgi:hypothetical protein
MSASVALDSKAIALGQQAAERAARTAAVAEQRAEAAAQQRQQALKERVAEPPAGMIVPVDDHDEAVSDDDDDECAAAAESDEEPIFVDVSDDDSWAEAPPDPQFLRDSDIHRDRGGRPRTAPPPLNEPAWRVPASAADNNCHLTLQQLLDQLLQVQTKHNGSHALFSDLFDVLRGVLPKDSDEPRLPLYRQARQLAAQSSATAEQKFAVCPEDCALKPLDKLDATDLAKLKKSSCQSCQGKYSENGKEFDKVRLTTVTLCEREGSPARLLVCTHDCLACVLTCLLSDC